MNDADQQKAANDPENTNRVQRDVPSDADASYGTTHAEDAIEQSVTPPVQEAVSARNNVIARDNEALADGEGPVTVIPVPAKPGPSPEANQEASQPSEPRRKPRLHVRGFLGETLRTVIFVIVVTVLFDLAIPRSLVEGRSMVPTFHDGDRLIVSRVHYLFDKPDHNDFIVFNSMSPNEPNTMIIKRVIGVPGDTIELRDQRVYLNGQEIEEDYINEACATYNCPDERVELGEDEYFVMGDNRNHSYDSRDYGAVTLDHIIGRVILRYWPLDALGLLE